MEAALTPWALEKVARECTQHSFDTAARNININIDWGVEIDGKQLQRWTLAVGERVVAERDGEVAALECGHPPLADKPESAPKLLVIEVDGGTVQTTVKDPDSGSRWKGTKVGTVSTYVPGDGAEIKPQKLLTTLVSNTGGPDEIGQLLRCEAERRNLSMADVLLVIADCGNWIDPLVEKHFGGLVTQRIADWFHATEHLSEAARAATVDSPHQHLKHYEQWKSWLWDGEFELLLNALRTASENAGSPQKNDPPGLPRVILHRNLGYFTNHREHMNYPEYRRKGWPIGSGVIESGVKQIGKRVKGSDKFWHIGNAERVMALRDKWLSEDGRWERYWASRPAYLKTSA